MTPVPAIAAEDGAGGAILSLGIAIAVTTLAGLPLALLLSARTGAGPARTGEVIGGSPLAATLVGSALGVVALVLAAGVPANPALGIPALAATALLAAAAFNGLVAEARRLGGELRARDPAGGPDAGATAVGWLVLSGLPLLPFAGPLAWLYLALRGAGASVVALLRRPA
ncbi:MAG TPA: hypothetical protein VFS92_06560 [Planctomycetota bacterium]|nr:hypothetical protein [Planctomycetota bacterium]